MIFFGCLALLAAGCNKIETVEAPVEEPVVESPDHLIVDITVGTESETRAVKTGWENGDKIYVFFDHFFLDYVSDPNIGTNGQGSPKYSYDVCYLTLTYNGSGWQSEFSQEGLETYLSGQSSGTIAAVYYQHLDNPKFRCLHGNRNNREEFYVNVENLGLFSGFYMFTQGDTYTVSDGRLMATLNMHLNERAVRFAIPEMQRSSRFQGLMSDQLVRELPEVISSVNLNGAGFQAPTVQTTNNGNVLYPIFEDSQMVFDGCLKSDSYQGQEMEYVLQLRDKRSSPSVKDDLYHTLTKTATLYGKDAIILPQLNDAKWVKSYQSPCEDRGFYNGHEWVLMGDGRKWAAMNYGAQDHYTDDDVECGTRDQYVTWEDASNCFQNDWGEGWRLPTYYEWLDLLRAETTNFVKVYNDAGHFTGMMVKRLDVSGSYEVEHLFLPTSYGYLEFDGGNLSRHGDPDGFYWTATAVSSNTTEAWDLELAESSEGSVPTRMRGMKKSYYMFARAILDK